MSSTHDDQPLHAGGFSPASTLGDNQEAPLAAAGFEPLNASAAPQRQAPWRWLLLALTGLVVLMVLGFLFTARSLEIVVNAEGPATIDVDGWLLPLGQRYLVRPGEYPVRIEVPGYREFTDTLVVTDADSQTFTASPAILPGLVSLRSAPAEAAIYLDDQLLGQTPLLDQAIAAGSYTLKATAPRYQPYTQTLEVTGRGVAQTLAIDLNPDWAAITVPTIPSATQLLIDGEPAGLGGEPLDVLSGVHTLTIRAPGYADTDLTLEVMAGVDQTLDTVSLRPANGLLTLSTDPVGANVMVDGQFVGRTPLSTELSPGREHLVQVSKAGFNRSSLRLSLEQGASAERKITLSPQLGDVEFRIAPAGAKIVVNGIERGTGPQTIPLPAVEQRIEVRLDGYASFRTRVTPREGLKQVVDITLLTEADARRAALTPEVTTALGQTLRLIDPVAEPVNEFPMGASRREPGRRSNEVLHTVRLERAFYLATTETTNAQFRQFVAEHDSGQIEGNSLNREHQPAVRVSWQQAARFCNWLSAKEGLPPFYRENQGIINGYNASSIGYRLPTEAEWAYASRVEGENLRKFAWGEEFPPSQAVVNVADNTSALVTGRILNGYADGHIVAAPVASFPANHRGLYDMGGNVAEWVHDVYAIPSANAEVATDPLGALSGDNYTVRGASWALSRLSELRLTFRDYGAAGRDDLGFRIARYAE